MSAQHKLKFEQHEATHRGTVNTDYVLTEGRAADNRDLDDYAEPCDDGEVAPAERAGPTGPHLRRDNPRCSGAVKAAQAGATGTLLAR
jgi:hypothetical protein